MSLSDLVTMTTSMGSSMNPVASEHKLRKPRELLGDAKRTRDRGLHRNLFTVALGSSELVTPDRSRLSLARHGTRSCPIKIASDGSSEYH
jgi:hypothetical protein